MKVVTKQVQVTLEAWIEIELTERQIQEWDTPETAFRHAAAGEGFEDLLQMASDQDQDWVITAGGVMDPDAPIDTARYLTPSDWFFGPA